MTFPISQLWQSETGRHSPPQLRGHKDRGHLSVREHGVIALFRKVKQVTDSAAWGLCSLITFSKVTKDLAMPTWPHEVRPSVCKPSSQHRYNRWCLQGREQHPTLPDPQSNICDRIINQHAALFTATWEKTTVHSWRSLIAMQVMELLNKDVKPDAPYCNELLSNGPIFCTNVLNFKHTNDSPSSLRLFRC